MKLDISLQNEHDLSQLSALTKHAEEIGFDGIWSAEVSHDPFIQLALASTTTERLELGTAIALSFTRSPMSLAYTAFDLAQLSNGRFIMGLGTQVKAHNERRFGVPWLSPLPRLREVIESMRAVWHSWRTGERLNYRGEHYKLTLMTPFFTPPAHEFDIPIYIAGVNTGLCRLAGEVADGFHVHPLNSVAYLNRIVRPTIQAGAEAGGRSSDDIKLSASVFVITGETDEEKTFWREFVRQQISFYASTPSYRIIFETHGWANVQDKLSPLAARKKWEDMPALITDEMLETFAIIAEPDEVGSAIVERYDGLVDRVTPYIPFEPGKLDVMWKSAREALSS